MKAPSEADLARMLRQEYEAIHGPPPGEEPGPLDERLRSFYREVHALTGDRSRSGLCLSGGGIRSAAFSLGVLQALARAGVLPRFHYLSTVSGGGYIGSWLTAWIHRHFSSPDPGEEELPRSERLAEVTSRLAWRTEAGGLGGDTPPEPEQIAHVRRFTNYLSPRTGALSLDTWTLAAVYLRNLLLNWLVVVPLLASALLVPSLLAEALRTAGWFPDPAAARAAAVLVPAGLFLFAWLVLALRAILFRKRGSSIAGGEKWSRREGALLRAALAWAGFSALVLYGPGLLARVPGLLGAGLLSSLGTWALKKLGDRGRRQSDEAKQPSRTIRAATTAAALATILVIIVALAAVLNLVIGRLPDGEPLGAVLLLLGLSLLVSWVAALLVDINEFSLHALYRNRLVRAFLRASRGAEAPRSDTAFDDGDDLPLADLWPRGPAPADAKEAPHLFHVINATLNDLGGSRPEWNERKGVSFTFSPRHVGAHIPGRYHEPGAVTRGGYLPLERDVADPLRLGTAMSISGAAASPNMGYHSSPVVTFLMALFNVRLGWWMHPPWDGHRSPTALRRSPLLVWRAWIAEALGGTRFTDRVVNVSDGGHFDNLGLYEMVRRRCRYIVVIDAGQDGSDTFESLAEAFRKIRVDFGIPIAMAGMNLTGRKSAAEGAAPRPQHAWHGTIRYSAVDRVFRNGNPDQPAPDGELIYLRPRVTGDEPVDVQSYGRTHPDFPHESTADQWFSESQFESYRALGEHAVQHIMDYYRVSKGLLEPDPARAPGAARPVMSPEVFCHRVAESLALMRRHREDSTHAGGVVYRLREGEVEFLLVRSTDQLHRILPKGYIEPWEDAVAAAIREVREEAGYDLRPEQSLGVASFTTPTRQVTTTYFLMEPAVKERAEPGPLEDYRAPAWFTIDAAAAQGSTVPDDVVSILRDAEAAIPTHAGGVVWRRVDGRLEFLLVRSKDGRYRVLPKGHIEDVEDAEDAAVREVAEEAGLNLDTGRPVGIWMFDGPAGPVRTRYFLMEASDAAEPGAAGEPEREPIWMSIDDARASREVPADAVAVLERGARLINP